jgi:hypothetical protein
MFTTDDGDGHHDIFKVMTKAHMALVNICYCWFVLPAIHVNNSMFIKNLSQQHVENVTLLHIEINDHMSVSRLLLDNGCENLQANGPLQCLLLYLMIINPRWLLLHVLCIVITIELWNMINTLFSETFRQMLKSKLDMNDYFRFSF